jgi:hypothetical protein
MQKLKQSIYSVLTKIDKNGQFDPKKLTSRELSLTFDSRVVIFDMLHQNPHPTATYVVLAV